MIKKKKILGRICREIKEAKLKTKLLLLMNGDYIIDQVPIPWQISSSPISFHSHTADLAPCRLVWVSIPLMRPVGAPCVNYSTMISLIVISFMRSVPSLIFIIQPLLERSIVITVFLYLLSVKLYPAPKELSVFFFLIG